MRNILGIKKIIYFYFILKPNKTKMKKLLSILTGVAFLCLALVPTQVGAQSNTDNTTVTATIGTYLTFSTTDPATLSLTAGAAPTDQTSALSMKTNNANGYHVDVKAEDSNDQSTASLWLNASNDIDAAASSAVVTDSNYWGIYVSTFANGTIDAGYDDDTTADVAISTSDDRILYKASSATTPENATITYTAAVDDTLDTGDYTATVTYTMVAGVGS